MKKLLFVTSLVAAAHMTTADIIPFDISPVGVSPATGLSPSNEFHMVMDSSGTGDKVLSGITYDTDNMTLKLFVGYGASALFSNLTGPATAAHIHGPATAQESALVLIDLGTLHVPDSDPAQGGIIFGQIDLSATPDIASNILAGLTYINIHTASNPQGEIRGQLIPDFSTDPQITSCPDPQVVECEGPRGTPTTLTVDVMDKDGDPLEILWTVDGKNVQTNLLAAGEARDPISIQLIKPFALGTHDVVITVSDANSTPATCTTSVTVQDTVAPVIESITATPNVLWPPNHKMATVTVKIQATDACGPLRARIVDVLSNEDDNGLGDGNTDHDVVIRRNTGTSSDWRIIAPLRVQLRKERSGNGSGRIYTVIVEVRDAAGNASRGRVQVTVPHDQGKSSKANKGKSSKAKKGKKK